ncbi:MAG: hypothetical protein O3C60_15670, partial [Planctomycetota bacterium]|nr:hypothetical protein [Planctomycetota bacterium]
VTDRGWQTWGTSPLGWQSWSLAEHSVAIKQLSKLKFNRIVLEVAPWHPFVSYEFAGIGSTTALLWRGEKFALEGDVVGKKAMPHGLTVFSNVDFNAAPSYDAVIAAGRRYLQGLQDVTQKYHMKLALHLTGQEIGREFSDKFSVSANSSNDILACLEKTADAAPLLEVLSKSYQEQFPSISEITWAAEKFQPGQPLELQQARGGAPSDGAKGSKHEGTLSGPLAVPQPVAHSRLLIGALGSSSGFLPQTYVASFPSTLKNATSLGWNAVSTTASTPFEADWPVADVARSLWDSASDVKSMFIANWVAMTGKQAAAERLWLAEEKIQQAEALIAKYDPQFGNIGPQMLMRHFQNEPAPEWWQEVTAAYDAYLTESYRAHGAVEGRAKDLLYYRAKRGEFAFEYMKALAAVRDAAIQHGSGNAEASEEAMGTALEDLYNAITHLSDAARDNSDRALIAALNTYAYRPLQAASDELGN